MMCVIFVLFLTKKTSFVIHEIMGLDKGNECVCKALINPISYVTLIH